MYDLIIAGGGPAGVAAGIYASRKMLKGILITDLFGGQSVVAAEIQNFIGVKSISGFNLAKILKEHLQVASTSSAQAQKGIKIIEEDLVAKIEKAKDGFKATTKKGKIFKSRTVLIASGSRQRKLNIPGEKEFEGRGVFYCSTCDAPLMKGKIAAVIGGGNSGFEAALDLLPYASKIYLLTRTGVLKADPIVREKVRDSKKVKIITMTGAEEIFGEEFVQGLKYRDRRSGKAKEILLQGVFAAVGYQPNSEIVKNLVKLTKAGEIVVNPATQETSCRGIWAAGNVTDGLYRQINISIGDAIKAVLNIYQSMLK